MWLGVIKASSVVSRRYVMPRPVCATRDATYYVLVVSTWFLHFGVYSKDSVFFKI